MSKRPDVCTYADRRRMLLLELRIMRMTKPAWRVVKHMQRLMRSLRGQRARGEKT